MLSQRFIPKSVVRSQQSGHIYIDHEMVHFADPLSMDYPAGPGPWTT